MRQLTNAGYDTDKGPAYLTLYERFFAPLQQDPIVLLELGVHNGGSLRMWRDYFPNGRIVGLDINERRLRHEPRIEVFQGDASVSETYAMIEREAGVGVFDIVIDDASHFGSLTKTAFSHLFLDRLSPGGLYVLEDWGTSYHSGWPDGEVFRGHQDTSLGAPHRVRFSSHDWGMAGFVKQLVDMVAFRDIIVGGGDIVPAPIEAMSIHPGLVFLKKIG